MRIFIGIALSPDVSAQLSDCLGGLKSRLDPAAVRWQPAENYHLTLQFIGHIERQLIPLISQALKQAVRGVVTFNLPLTEIACFPDAKSVVVAALAKPEESLLELVEKTGRALEQLGLSRDHRRFQPHITLGRIRQRPLALGPNPLTMRFSVERIAIFQSDSAPDGVVYSVLADFPLEA